MIRKLTLTAGAALALASTPAWAIVDTLGAGETKLDATQDKFAIWIDDATEVGNSVRVHVRPRNGNCVTANAYPVTPSGYNSIDGTNGQPTDVASVNPKLHNNPMCDDHAHDGYFSVDRWSDYEETVSYVLHGTLHSYKIEVTFSDRHNGAPSNVIKLRSN